MYQREPVPRDNCLVLVDLLAQTLSSCDVLVKDHISDREEEQVSYLATLTITQCSFEGDLEVTASVCQLHREIAP